VLVVDSQGTVHVAWQDNTPGNWSVFYSSKPKDGPWSEPFNVSRNISNSGAPSLAMDSNDTLYLAYDTDSPGIFVIFCVSKPRGGTWSGPVNISGTSAKSGDPSIAVDSQRRAHIAWSEYVQNHWNIFYTSVQGIAAK
jgi:hypothetical protein